MGLYREILRTNARDHDALHMLGVAALQCADSRRAVALIAQALALNPTLRGAHANLGTALLADGRLEESLASYDRALQFDPDSAGVLFNRGNTLRRLARHRDALDTFDRALRLRPDHAGALCHRGLTLLDLGRPLEALASFDLELRSRPADTIALRNRGAALLSLERLPEALDSFDEAVRLDPADAEAQHDRGNALQLLGRLDEALGAYDRVLAMKPEHVNALYNRGDMLLGLTRYEESAQSFAALLAIAPDHDYALGQWAHARLRCCDWDGHAEYTARLGQRVLARHRSSTPFAFLTAVDSPAGLHECGRQFVADRYPPQSPLWTGERYRHERIRVAYLSSDFHDHATAYLTARLFEEHDRAKFDIAGVSFGPPDNGELRARLQRSFDRFLDVRTLSHLDVARHLREQEIDILVDLKGFTNGARPHILAYRAAPIQVSYLGFPGTTGADYLDYVLADRHVIPPEYQEHYSEKVVYLPDCYQVNDSARPIADRKPVRAELGLPENGFVFCCFNSSYKLTPQFFDVWTRLLRQVPGSVLWLFRDGEAMARNLRREAVERGVEPGRLVFAERVRVEQHLARLQAADLFLDTLPCNAHTTASDALWAGVPLLTCAGESFAARIAMSLLHAVGLPELITTNLGDYEGLALRLATEPALLAQIRTRLSDYRKTRALFDTRRFCRHLEAAYTLMWERAQRGEAPAAFCVKRYSE